MILGDDMVLEDTVNAQPVLQDFLSLIMRHWNVIVDLFEFQWRYFFRCF